MITIAINPLITTFLIAIRLGMVLLLSPIDAIRLLPMQARLLLVFVLSVIMVANMPSLTIKTDDLSLVASALSECCNGLILSLGLYASFGAFQMAGQLIDTQMGLNSLAILNPADHSHDALSSRLLVMLAVLFFFMMDGHHALIQGLAMSFMLITPGKMVLFNGFLAMLYQYSLMFSLTILIASPVVISLLMIDITGAIITRNMPQINTYFLIIPIKIMMGLFMSSMLLSTIKPLMQTIFSWYFQSLQRAML